MKIQTGRLLQSLQLDENSLYMIIRPAISSMMNIVCPHPHNRIMGHISQLGLRVHIPSLEYHNALRSINKLSKDVKVMHYPYFIDKFGFMVKFILHVVHFPQWIHPHEYIETFFVQCPFLRNFILMTNFSLFSLFWPLTSFDV